MKRYAFTFAIMAITSCAFLYMFGVLAVLVFAVVLSILAILTVLFMNGGAKRSIAAILLAAALFCLYIGGFRHFKVEKAEKLIGTTAEVSCIIIDNPSSVGNETVLSVKTTDQNSKEYRNLKFELWVSDELDAASAVCGDVLSARVEFYETDGIYKASNLSEGIYLSTYTESVQIIGHKDILYKPFVDFRRSIEKYITKNFNLEQRSVLSGVLLGDTSLMSEKVYSDFKVCGVAHVTAVSGMHISILCGAFLSFFSLFMRKRTASLVTLVPLFAVVATVGFTPSAIRAGIMCALILMGNALLKNTESLNSLGVSATLMLLFNPYYICSLAFNLSCLATAGVIVFSRYGNKFVEKYIKIKSRFINIILSSAVMTFIQSIGAVLFTLPLQILYFGAVSLIAPISSMLICGAISYLLIVSVFALVFYFANIAFLMQGFVIISKLICEYIVITIGALAKIPFSYITFSDRYVVLWAALSLVLIGLWILFKNIGGIRTIALAIAALFLVSVWSQNIFERDSSGISIINAGTGFIAAVSTDEAVVIIGCGDENADYYAAKAYMRLNGKAKVDALIVPSYQDYCYGGYKGVLKHLSPENVVLPDNIEDKEVVFQKGDLKITALKAKHGLAFEVSIKETKNLINCSGAIEGNTQKYDYCLLTAGSISNVDAKAAVVMGYYNFENSSKIKRIVDFMDKSVTIKIKHKKGYRIYAG